MFDLARCAPAYATSAGQCYNADSLGRAARELPDDSVALVDDFAAVRAAAAEDLRQCGFDGVCEVVLAVRGRDSMGVGGPTAVSSSDESGAWKPRSSGTRSLYQYELVIRLMELFYLAQEFYWYNPSKTADPGRMGDDPAHARQRCADDSLVAVQDRNAADRQSPGVEAVLSPSMKRLLRDGYDHGQPGRRSTTSARTSAATTAKPIPPNLLVIPNNTRSGDEYFRRCRAAGKLPIHLRALSNGVPEFFIRFLTEAGQLVVDPFAGSNVTGFRGGRSSCRQWLGIELDGNYVAGSLRGLPGCAGDQFRPSAGSAQRREAPRRTS